MIDERERQARLEVIKQEILDMRKELMAYKNLWIRHPNYYADPKPKEEDFDVVIKRMDKAVALADEKEDDGVS